VSTKILIKMRQASNLLLLILTIGLVIYSCDKQNNSKVEPNDNGIVEFDLIAAKVKIQEQTKKFTEAHLTKDTAYLNNSFTEDAKVFPPNSEIVRGRKNIAQLNSDWVNYGIYEFKEESTSFYGNQHYLIDEGMYYLRYGKENIIDEGKYINIWKNDNGEWKIHSNIWNTNLPMENTESEY
jgi:ketosteroid isomerase-like protein